MLQPWETEYGVHHEISLYRVLQLHVNRQLFENTKLNLKEMSPQSPPPLRLPQSL